MADTINETLENLKSSIVALADIAGACCQSGGGPINPPPNSSIPSYGGMDDDYPDSEAYFDARCNACNGIFDTLRETVLWLEVNHVDLKAGVFGGITTGLITALTLSGPAGWAVVAISSLIAILAGWIIAETLDFEQLGDAFDDEHTDLVKSLYNSQTVDTARDNFITVLDGSTFPTSFEEQALIKFMMGYELLNQIFNPREDMANYDSSSPIDCGSFILQLWSFVASGEGWAFRDDSTGTYSASGQWVGAREAWEINLVGLGTGHGPAAIGTIYITGLSIAVDITNSVQFDHSATSDAIIVSRRITVIYSDLSEQTFITTPSKDAGTVIMTIEGAKTIAEIEIEVGRNSAAPFDATIDILEVRVQ